VPARARARRAPRAKPALFPLLSSFTRSRERSRRISELFAPPSPARAGGAAAGPKASLPAAGRRGRESLGAFLPPLDDSGMSGGASAQRPRGRSTTWPRR
jgi:hypothetical protein